MQQPKNLSAQGNDNLCIHLLAKRFVKGDETITFKSQQTIHILNVNQVILMS